MAERRQGKLKRSKADETLRGHRLLKPIKHLVARLHPVGAERDQAGNRKLFFDQYVTLLLLYFCNSSLTSLRGLQQATGWEKAGEELGIRGTSLGSLSEAATIF